MRGPGRVPVRSAHMRCDPTGAQVPALTGRTAAEGARHHGDRHHPEPVPHRHGVRMSDSTAPQADTTLAALAFLERFEGGEFADVDALLAVTDERELVIGLLDVSRMLTSMLSRAGETTPQDVIAHVRGTVLGLINDGSLSAGSFTLPKN